MALWLRPQSAIRGQPRWPRFFDHNDHTSPGRRPRSIHGNLTFPASTRRRSKTRRDPFAASSMTAQSRCSSTSLPPWMAHNRPAPPGCARGRARRHPNRLAAFQPNSAARPAQFSPPVKNLLQSLKNWRHRCGGMSVSGRWWSRRATPSIQLEGMRRGRTSAGTSSRASA
jgi:hypothetical protein